MSVLTAVCGVEELSASSICVLACVKCKNGDPRPDWLLLKHSRQRTLNYLQEAAKKQKCEIISTQRTLEPQNEVCFIKFLLPFSTISTIFNRIKMEKKLDPTGHY